MSSDSTALPSGLNCCLSGHELGGWELEAAHAATRNYPASEAFFMPARFDLSRQLSSCQRASVVPFVQSQRHSIDLSRQPCQDQFLLQAPTQVARFS